uniref:Uncharacterized protein n=1 Tax=Setaria viridis TaxID=4556 RepID=A0A4U6U276_SETVI|nr:hypothetical protein SEVIR_6G112000v2 [Setaria viridis]
MAGDRNHSVDKQDGLPLIMCTECGLRRVVRCRSKQKWSLGQIFYCCPLHKEYIDVLASRGLLPASASAYNRAGSMQVAESSMAWTDSKMKEDVGLASILSLKEGQELIAICRLVVVLLKALCFLGVCMLLVMLVHLFK